MYRNFGCWVINIGVFVPSRVEVTTLWDAGGSVMGLEITKRAKAHMCKHQRPVLLINDQFY
jgi:hypothetical protein